MIKDSDTSDRASAYDIASTIGGPADPFVRDVDGQPGQHGSPQALPHRKQVEIDAQSGQALDSGMQHATLAAARRASIARTVEQAGQGLREHLSFLFGVRDRDAL